MGFWDAIASIGSSILGGVISSSASKSAADTASAAEDRAAQVQWDMYNQTRQDQLPMIQAAQGATNALWGTPSQVIPGAPIYAAQAPGYDPFAAGASYYTPMAQAIVQPNALTSSSVYARPISPSGGWETTETGQRPQTPGPQPWETAAQAIQMQNALTQMGYGQQQPIGYQQSTTTPGTQGLIQKGPGEFKESESYKWTLGQGLEAQQRQASATGRMGSGAYIKDATKYAEGLASAELDNFQNRWLKMLDPYFRMLGYGSNVSIAAGNQAYNTGNALANTMMQSGNYQALGTMGVTNPWVQNINQVPNYLAAYQNANRGTNLNNANALNQYWQQANYTPQQMNTMSWL